MTAPRWRRTLQTDLALSSGAGLLALLATAVVLKLWHANPSIPLGYGGDGLWLTQVVKGMLDHGWFFTNPDVGAPFGQQLYDFTAAFGDTLHFAVIKAMSLVSQDPVKLVNGYFLLSFFLCAFSACFVLRRLGVSRGAAVVAAVLFSLLPAHVAGGLGRVPLGAYWAIPLAALLIMRVFAGEPLFTRRAEGGRLSRWLSRPSLATAGMCVLIAGSGLYYALFTVMLLVLAAAAGVLVRRDWAVGLHGSLAAMLVLGLLIVALAPSLVYTREHGKNTAFERPAADGSIYATSLSLLIVPFIGHRFGPADDLAHKLEVTKLPPGQNEHQLSALGLVGSLGFLGLLVAGIVPRARGGRDRAGAAAAAALTGFLLATTGGIGLLVNILLTSDLRGWGRISPLLGFLGLYGAALAYDALRGSPWVRGWRRHAVAGLLPLALVVGVADQTTANMVPEYAVTKKEFTSDARFVDAVDRELPARASVLQLPAAAFPEGGTVVNMADYSLMRGPLLTEDLRFSYGSMKGRPHGDWVQRLAELPLAEGLSYYAAAGFRGIWVDRRGYADQGNEIDAELRRLLPGVTPIQSADTQLRFYSLVDYARRWARGRTPQWLRAARDSAMNLSEFQIATGMTLVPATPVPQIEDPRGGGTFALVNPGRFARTIVVRGRLFVAGPDTPVVARPPDGRRVRLTARKGRGGAFALRARVPAGGRVNVRISSPAARSALQLPELRVTDDALRPR